MSWALPTLHWQPTATLSTLRSRAKFIATIRQFFEGRDVLEVQTPILSQYANPDPQLLLFSTAFHPLPSDSNSTVTYYLSTSPEYPMKRLLCAGSGPIFQITPAFRNGELGRLHNPEFTMLEWYRPGYDMLQLQEEVKDLMHYLLPTAPSARIYRYREIFQSIIGLDPCNCRLPELQTIAKEKGCSDALQKLDKSSLVQVLFSMLVEPCFDPDAPTFVTHFPAEQAMLAQLTGHDPRTCERFELYYGGSELANGFLELNCPLELAKRFEKDNSTRKAKGLTPLPVDAHLLAAQVEGLPSCSGVALGVDRLFSLAQGLSDIATGMAFDFHRA